ncbi:MAG TPA: hypothetical protein VGI60_02580 [Chthoniobacterales bacterium]
MKTNLTTNGGCALVRLARSLFGAVFLLALMLPLTIQPNHAGGNTYLVSYEGRDGNDLTLTVQ